MLLQQLDGSGFMRSCVLQAQWYTVVYVAFSLTQTCQTPRGKKCETLNQEVEKEMGKKSWYVRNFLVGIIGIWKSQAGAVDITVLRFRLCNFSVFVAAILKQEKHLEVCTFGGSGKSR